MQNNTKFFIYATGIFICYFYFGILQEKITRGKYTFEIVENGNKNTVDESYTYSSTLVFVLCLVNYLFAKGMLYAWPQAEDKTPTVYCASAALTYLLAMVSSYMALQWIAYPTQVVGKSAKPIPVMILGVLIGHKSYAFKKYLFVLLIVIGVVLFMFKDKGGLDKNTTTFGIGEILIILSLTMDGLTGAIQERMKAEAQPTAQQMMRGMNAWSCIFIGGVLILSGELIQFFEFVSRHPSVLSYISLLSLTGALGQLFIFLMVAEFGPLPCAVITTTRKFFTVLASIIIFGNQLSVRQWIGAVAVFSGLFMDAYFSKSGPKKK